MSISSAVCVERTNSVVLADRLAEVAVGHLDLDACRARRGTSAFRGPASMPCAWRSSSRKPFEGGVEVGLEALVERLDLVAREPADDHRLRRGGGGCGSRWWRGRWCSGRSSRRAASAAEAGSITGVSGDLGLFQLRDRALDVAGDIGVEAGADLRRRTCAALRTPPPAPRACGTHPLCRGRGRRDPAALSFTFIRLVKHAMRLTSTAAFSRRCENLNPN